MRRDDVRVAPGSVCVDVLARDSVIAGIVRRPRARRVSVGVLRRAVVTFDAPATRSMSCRLITTVISRDAVQVCEHGTEVHVFALRNEGRPCGGPPSRLGQPVAARATRATVAPGADEAAVAARATAPPSPMRPPLPPAPPFCGCVVVVLMEVVVLVGVDVVVVVDVEVDLSSVDSGTVGDVVVLGVIVGCALVLVGNSTGIVVATNDPVVGGQVVAARAGDAHAIAPTPTHTASTTGTARCRARPTAIRPPPISSRATTTKVMDELPVAGSTQSSCRVVS